LNIRFITSQATEVNASYFEALAMDEDLGRTRGIDATLKQFNLDALLLPTNGMYFPTGDKRMKSLIRLSLRLHSGTCSNRRIPRHLG
jgi:hypothetical protein